ncbi:MAG: DnaJ domain-containing protein [Henriciella sp.]|nr:DnaJ domain-containing protein [Henriciella sp.]
MLWKSMGHIFIAQAVMVFAYIIWPKLQPLLLRLADWIRRKYGDDENIAYGGDKEEAGAFQGKWRAYEEQAYRKRSEQARFRQRTYRQTSPPPPPAEPLTPRHAHMSLLGLQKGASRSQIKKAYRKLAKTYHPDRFASKRHSDAERAEASAKMREVNEAYDWLQENPL